MSDMKKAERLERLAAHEHVQSKLAAIAADAIAMRLFEKEEGARIEALVEAHDDESRRVAQAEVKAWRALVQMIRLSPKVQAHARSKIEELTHSNEVT